MSPPLDCQTVLERLECHLDGELSPIESRTVEAHLDGCAGCSAELELTARIRAELRSWPELDAPPRVLRAVYGAIGSERFAAARERRRAPQSRPAWIALAAAALAALILGSILYRSRPPAIVAPATMTPADGPAVASVPELEDLDPAEVARATEEAKIALAYVARVSRRTGLKVRDDVLLERLVRPSTDTLGRALRPLGLAAGEPDAAAEGSRG